MAGVQCVREYRGSGRIAHPAAEPARLHVPLRHKRSAWHQISKSLNEQPTESTIQLTSQKTLPESLPLPARLPVFGSLHQIQQLS